MISYDNIPVEELNEYGVHKNDKEEECFVCGTKTIWFDSYMKVPACRPKCSREISREILKEVRRLNEIVARLEERIDRFMR